MTSVNTSLQLWVLALRISIWSDLQENKKYGVKGLRKMFPNKDWKRDALKVLIDTTGTIDRRPDSGRPRTVCTTAIIHQVEDQSLSQ